VKVQPAVIGAAIGRLVASTTLLDVGSGVRSIITLCEQDYPHLSWSALRKIDYTADAAALGMWFNHTLSSETPSAPLRALYFPVSQSILESGEVTDDMQVVGTAEFEPEDINMEWIFSRHYFPDAYASSAALHEVYGIAYGTHTFGVEIKGVLGNDAEWPVGLAYAVLATRAVLQGRTVGDLPTDSKRVGIAAGWGEGDLLLIGEITEDGFMPKSVGGSQSRASGAPNER
jgi:hypothetical protein